MVAAVLAADLFAGNRDLAIACRDHPFVQGIASGALERAAFCGYVAQDATFLDAFVRAYELGARHATDSATKSTFETLLAGGREELELHAGYATRWDVDLSTEPLPATSAYTEFLLAVAEDEPVGHLCAAMTPCMRLYAWLGTELAPTASPTSPYIEWVHTYADPGFEQLARTLEGLLDRVGGDAAIVEAHYRTAMRMELEFFDAALVSAP